ncbi:MAG: RNA polymerase sigma factor [Bacteroidetes bacterium]|nr:RNA polymerase sigma factor [Bacteroidota bacterium]
MEQEELKQQAELIAACLVNDHRALKKFYDMFAPKMYGVCLRYTDSKDDAKDLLHDGFIKALQALKSFRNEGSLEGWMRRIFVNKALENIRSKKMKMAESDLDVVENQGFDAHIDFKLSKDEIVSEIQKLAVGYRTVLNLFVMEGYSHEEISKMLDISISTSKSQLFRARQILSERLKKMNQWETQTK